VRTRHILARALAAVSISTVAIAAAGTAYAATPAHSGASTAHTAPQISNLVKVEGQTQGISLVSQNTNNDGSVTVQLKSASGVTYGYSGAPGAQLVVSQPVVRTTSDAKQSHTLSVAVSLTAPSSSALAKAAASDYRNQGRSEAKDAARLGITLKKQATISPANTIVTSWCTTQTVSSEWITASSCDTRTLLQSGNYYIADQVQTIAQDAGPYFTTAVATKMEYPSGNTIVFVSPAGEISTGCTQPVTYSATLYGVGFSVPINTCAGRETTAGTGSGLGETAWGGQISVVSQGTEIDYEPLFEVHANGENPTTKLVLTLAYNT
jgi:hypothetical protein